MALMPADIKTLFATRGLAWYGSEPVSQLEHALQCAHLAQSEGAPAALVAACLLHDLGHLLGEASEDPAMREIDDAHQYVVMPFLRPQFPEDVLAPIRLHVDAKRYLCAVEPDYWLGLSDASRCSLELQGGPFSRREAVQFIAQPHAKSAVRLRRWDDRAKQPYALTPDLAHFMRALEDCLQAGDGGGTMVGHHDVTSRRHARKRGASHTP